MSVCPEKVRTRNQSTNNVQTFLGLESRQKQLSCDSFAVNLNRFRVEAYLHTTDSISTKLFLLESKCSPKFKQIMNTCRNSRESLLKNQGRWKDPTTDVICFPILGIGSGYKFETYHVGPVLGNNFKIYP